MKRAAWGMVFVLGFASVASAGWRDLKGSPAPEVTADAWLNVPDGTPSVKSLEGRVWLLCFFGAH